MTVCLGASVRVDSPARVRSTREGDVEELNSLDLTFLDLLLPLRLEEFVERHLFREPVVIPGPTEKFSRFFSWDSLNRILSHQRLDPQQVKLQRLGAPAKELQFFDSVVNLLGETVQRVNPERLYQRLQEGSTLVIDLLDDMDPRVGALCDDISARFSATSSRTNLYASFGHSPGFNTHWDGRDVYALQVEGEKHWRVYSPERRYPLTGDHDPTARPQELWWEGVLSKGDLLYIPRGWWHEVIALDEPTLHVTISSTPMTGVDFVNWIGKRLRESELARMDLPRFASGDSVAAFEKELKETIHQFVDNASVEAYLDETRANLIGSPNVILPVGADFTTPFGGEDLVHLAPGASVRENPDGPRIVAAGKNLTLVPLLTPLARALSEGKRVSVASLRSSLPEVEPSDLDAFLAQMVAQGMLRVVLDT